MRRAVLLILLTLSALLLFIRFGLKPVSEAVGMKARAGIKVNSIPEAQVFINGLEVGKTPYQDEKLSDKEYLVKLVSSDAVWQAKVKLNQGTLAVVNRELAETAASSSGEILTLESGKGVVITSYPAGSSIEIDGKSYGQTPLSVSELSSGEHTFLISHDGFLKRSIRAYLPKDLLLNLSVDLAISELDLSTTATTPILPTPKLIVKQTPTGFLRVRDKPSLTGAEVGRLSPGQSLSLLEELSGWDRIKTAEGLEGYVSTSYVQKQS